MKLPAEAIATASFQAETTTTFLKSRTTGYFTHHYNLQKIPSRQQANKKKYER
jgi:hypothetical protein